MTLEPLEARTVRTSPTATAGVVAASVGEVAGEGDVDALGCATVAHAAAHPSAAARRIERSGGPPGSGDYSRWVLIREDLGTELARITRILSYAGALAADGRITTLAGEVVYIAARGIANATMTPYDIAIVRLADADVLRAEAPAGMERYLAVYRSSPLVRAVAQAADGSLVKGLTLLACAKATLLRADPEDSWDRAEREATARGAFIGLSAD